MPSTDVKTRIQALRQLLESERASTQEELRTELEKLDFIVNQSTISRDLRRLGAMKTSDNEGNTIYRLLPESTPAFLGSLADLVRTIQHNGAVIVVKTELGSASLIALHIDGLRSDEVLGTIAGDDTIFIAPTSIKKIGQLAELIKSSLEETSR